MSASEAPQGIMGHMVVKDTAAQIGATAVPELLNEADDDWYVYEPFQLPASRQTTNNLFTEQGTFGQYIIDSKVMRKVDTGESQIVVIRNSSATDGLIFTYIGRALLKLH